MAVPKRRTTRAKRDQRRAQHDRVLAPNVNPCPNCGEMMRPHRVCPSCGHYKGQRIFEMEPEEAVQPPEETPETTAPEG
ncbi:MAG: 50S ribosomal protein L32 [Myxococcales bacterium]|nr:50S ribosomal protein L32 [Myxococcales bacterium]